MMAIFSELSIIRPVSTDRTVSFYVQQESKQDLFDVKRKFPEADIIDMAPLLPIMILNRKQSSNYLASLFHRLMKITFILLAATSLLILW